VIKLIRSTFYNERETKEAVADFLLHADKLSMGEQCEAFERAFAIRQQRNFAVFVSSGSAANLVLVQAYLNLGRLNKGDRIGVSALTWPTNIMPLLQLGLEPVLIDVNMRSLNIAPDVLKRATSDLKALFLTNALGFCDDIDQIRRICEEKAILLFEDNCESLGSLAYGRLLGNFGNASTFSFFVGHHLSTIEGGMVCTDDEDLYEMLMVVRAHGWDRSLPEERRRLLRNQHSVNDFYARYTFYNLAYNCRPTEVNGFLGMKQIAFWDEIVGARAKNFEVFANAVAENDDLLKLDVSHMDVISNFAMPVICNDTQTFGRYKNRFESHGVEIRPIIAGDMSRQPFFSKWFGGLSNSCRNARKVHDTGFYFGNNPDLTAQEVELLCRLLKP
jgi:CDP-6-deoxy-D-xylo-4-hexulose-3-dehydrase